MADRTGIEWTDATWNPIVGCDLVSPGCTHCYAMSMAARIERMPEAIIPMTTDHIAAVFILATIWAVVVGMIAYRLIDAYFDDGEGW